MGAIGLEPTMPVTAGGLQPPEQPIAQYTRFGATFIKYPHQETILKPPG